MKETGAARASRGRARRGGMTASCLFFIGIIVVWVVTVLTSTTVLVNTGADVTWTEERDVAVEVDEIVSVDVEVDVTVIVDIEVAVAVFDRTVEVGFPVLVDTTIRVVLSLVRS